MKCVYACEMSSGIVKIGITGDLDARKQQLSYSVKQKIINCYQTDFCPRKTAVAVESACHTSFANKRIQGEFFNISFADACAELDSHADEIDAANRRLFEINSIKEALNRFYRRFGLYSNDKLGNAIGVKEVAGDVFGNDKSILTLGVLVKLAKKFNVSTDYILGLSNIPNSSDIAIAAVNLQKAFQKLEKMS